MSNIIDAIPDPVTNGIREWQKVRDAAKEALERCRIAQDESIHYRSQLEAIQTQCQNLELRNRALTEENAEYKMLLNDLGRRFLDVLESSRLSPFRPAGRAPTPSPVSPSDGGTAPRVSVSDYEDSLRDFAKTLSAKRDPKAR